MLPRPPFKKAKDKILGKKYELDLVFTDSKMMLRLNKTYRHKNETADVLSFSLSPQLGQIFINKKFTKNKKKLWALYLHGLAHLKGLHHG
ncbi:MAG: rRNA maturation RNAse YbeY [Patescibacteria group bacterium]